MVTLLEYARGEYVLARSLRPNSQYQLLRACSCFAAYLGGDPALTDLDDKTVNKWLAAIEPLYAPKTLQKMRGDVLAVWRDAFDAGECQRLPRRIRRIKVPKPCPTAWTPDEVARLVMAARKLPGRLPNGSLRSNYFGALVSAAWSTGLRRGDLWAIERGWIRDDGTIYRPQSKTGNGHCVRLGDKALSLLATLYGERPYEWLNTPRLFYYWWRKLKKIAGVLSDGAMQRLRISAATNVVADERGSPTKFLGHTSPRADVHYIDRSLVGNDPVIPRTLPIDNADLRQRELFAD